MILCVTLNPCLDKTLTVPPWQPGDSIRGLAVREVVGGKGNNVARALTRLGRTGPPRHVPGRPRRRPLRGPAPGRGRPRPAGDPDRGPHAHHPDGPDRGDVRADRLLRPRPGDLGRPRPRPSINRVEGALTEGGVTAMSLSGSSPSAATHGLYSDLIALARSRRVPVFLDSYGPALDAIWGFWPDVDPAQPSRGRRPSPPAPGRRRRASSPSSTDGRGTASSAASSPTAPARSSPATEADATGSSPPRSRPSTRSARATASSPA